MQDKYQEIKEYCTKEFLIPFEGTGPMDSNKNFMAYLCPAGIPTIAWGMTFDDKGVAVKLGDVWSYDKALKIKSKVLDSFLNELLKASPVLQNESTKRVAAILSWVYNLGIANYKSSSFKKAIDAKNWTLAANECKKWNKAKVKGVLTVLKGLTLRREKEAKVIGAV